MSGFLHGVETIELDVGLRSIQIVRSSVIGVIGTAPDADPVAFPADTPVLVAGSRTEAAKLGATGTLPAAIDGIFDQAGALIVVVRVEEGADAAATMANVIGGVDVNTGAYQGMQCFLAAENVVKVTPRILIAPGFTQNVAVTSEMIAIADRLRAVIFADGPNTNDADAITFRQSFGSGRVYVVDPWVRVFDTVSATYIDQPPSARVAGITARTDAENGFWWSPSNKLMNGIVGTSRDVSFGLSDPLCRANLLNEAGVGTIIQKKGYKLWGNRSTTGDPLWTFLSVRRTADMIYESIERGHMWAMDRPMSAQLILDIQNGVAEFLRSLQARGAVIGFNVWVDPDLNTEATLKAGQLFINFDFEPPAPLERLSFVASRNGDYYNELIKQVAAA